MFKFLSEAYAATMEPDPLIGILGATLNKADKCQSQVVLAEKGYTAEVEKGVCARL